MRSNVTTHLMTSSGRDEGGDIRLLKFPRTLFKQERDEGDDPADKPPTIEGFEACGGEI